MVEERFSSLQCAFLLFEGKGSFEESPKRNGSAKKRERVSPPARICPCFFLSVSFSRGQKTGYFHFVHWRRNTRRKKSSRHVSKSNTFFPNKKRRKDLKRDPFEDLQEWGSYQEILPQPLICSARLGPRIIWYFSLSLSLSSTCAHNPAKHINH